MSEKKDQISEKNESDSSDQTDHVCKNSILKEFLSKLKNEKLEYKTCDDDDDLTEKFEEQLHLKGDANKVSQALLRNAYLKNVCSQTKASSSASSDSTTDPEASKKDIASSIEAKSKEDMDSDIIKYLEMLKKIENTRYFKKYSELTKEKEIETEESKEEGCSKDGLSSTDTQTKAFSSPESDLEFSKVKKKLEEKEYLIFKINKCMQKFLEAFVENMKSEKVRERQEDVERLFEEYDNLKK